MSFLFGEIVILEPDSHEVAGFGGARTRARACSEHATAEERSDPCVGCSHAPILFDARVCFFTYIKGILGFILKETLAMGTETSTGKLTHLQTYLEHLSNSSSYGDDALRRVIVPRTLVLAAGVLRSESGKDFSFMAEQHAGSALNLVREDHNAAYYDTIKSLRDLIKYDPYMQLRFKPEAASYISEHPPRGYEEMRAIVAEASEAESRINHLAQIALRPFGLE